MRHRPYKNLLVLVALSVVGFSWLAGTKSPVEAAVTLVSFEVERVSTPTNLKVKWETETELDVVGFRVKRSTTNNIAQAVEAATDVPSRGSATRGAVYETLDTGGGAGLTTGQTYFYWLYELKNDGSEVLVTETPKSQSPGVPIPPTNTPLATATMTLTPTQPVPTNTSAAQKTPTHTPTVPRGANLTATPTTTPAQATATFTVAPQTTDTPISGAPTALPTSTSIPTEQTSVTSTPVVAVPPAIVEGGTPNPTVPTIEAKAGATVSASLEGVDAPTDQALQVPPTPTQGLDALAPSAVTSDVTPTSGASSPTPQAVAQDETAGAGVPAERLARPTATPRPTTVTETNGGSGSLLLILGGASLCGAVVLALAALVIWRRR